MNITYGKPVDIFKLKSDVQESFLDRVAKHHHKVELLFSDKEVSTITCPVCGTDCSSQPVIIIHGGKYLECHKCNHKFVGNRLSLSELVKFYKTSEVYSSTYTNKKTSDQRVKDVSLPKATWLINEFVKAYGRKPKSILDVGAGGGHMVRAYNLLGIQAQGIEISKDSNKFAKDNFDLKLLNKDYLKTSLNDFINPPEIISFWGVLEHVSSPISFLKKTKTLLSNQKSNLVVAAVPNFRSGSTAIQTLYPSTVLRNIGPESHLHMFTIESIQKAFELTGFEPVAAWYFGMDAYEFWTQIVTCNRIIEIKQNKDLFFRRLKQSMAKYKISKSIFKPISNLVEALIERPDISKDYNLFNIMLTDLQQNFDRDQASDEVVLAGKINK